MLGGETHSSSCPRISRNQRSAHFTHEVAGKAYRALLSVRCVFTIAISAGSSHTCAIVDSAKDARTSVCRGSGGMGQIGDDTANDRLIPTKVVGISGKYEIISAGAYRTCVGTKRTHTACWGNNRSGQLGYGYRNKKPAPDNMD